MLKNYFKHFLKHSSWLHKIFVYIIFLYLKFVYATSKWEFISPDGNKAIKSKTAGTLFALWHNRLAFGMHIYRGYNDVYALASPHTDGKVITDILCKMGYGVIEGSTNRNPMGALKEIIKKIESGSNIVITPDGPRGPKYKVNSIVAKLGYKYNKPVVPVSCAATKYFELKSWDKMQIPRAFGKIIVMMGSPINLSGNEKDDNLLLENSLIDLSNKARVIAK